MLSLLLLPDLGLKRWFGIPLSVHYQKITAGNFAVPLEKSCRNKDDRRRSLLFYAKIVNVTERKVNPSKCNVASLNFRSSEITFPNGLKSIILRPPFLRSPIIVFLVYLLLFCCTRKKLNMMLFTWSQRFSGTGSADALQTFPRGQAKDSFIQDFLEKTAVSCAHCDRF